MGKRARILVIDDDESIRDALKAILEEEGYTVDTAERGDEAIVKSQANYYSIALIDIRLPDMDGTKVLANLPDTTPKMRKIIITGCPSLQNAIEALNKGADAYITKPFDVDKVLKTIEEQLRKQEQDKKYSQQKVTEFIEARVKELEEEKLATTKRDS